MVIERDRELAKLEKLATERHAKEAARERLPVWKPMSVGTPNLLAAMSLVQGGQPSATLSAGLRGFRKSRNKARPGRHLLINQLWIVD